jgi:peptidyl-prolyl cis-trans isomerase C
MSVRAVVVEGVEIPEALIAREAQNHPSLTGQAAWDAAAKALAVRALLLQRAEELGLQAEPQMDEAGREETPEEALVRAVLDAEVEYSAPTDEEMRRFYEAQKARFVSPPLYEASHILVEPQDASADADEAARLLAAGAITDLRIRPELFGPLAETLSACPSGKLGGALGQLRPGDLVAEVEQALLALDPGRIAEAPVRSGFGWHVLRLDRLVESRQLPFDVVADRIRLHLESRAWSRAAARYAADLAARARLQGVALSLAPDGAVQEGSLTLGDLVSDAAAVARVEPWLAASDPALGRRVAEAAEAAGEGVAEFVRLAVAAFVAEADDERWTQLVSTAQGAEDSALAAISQILRSKLTPAKRSFTLIRKV